MNKNEPMRGNRYTVQPFPTARVYVLNGTLEEAFCALHRPCGRRNPRRSLPERTTTLYATF
jgi:hypothetical protein